MIVVLPCAFVLAAGAMGVWALMDMPVMGIKLAFADHGIRVAAIEDDGPLAGLIVPGEYVRAIGNVQLERDDILRYPEFVERRDENAWWNRQRAIYDELKNNNPVDLAIVSSAQEERTIQIKTIQWPLRSVMTRGFPVFLSGAILAVMSLVIYALSRSPVHRTCQVFFVSLGLYHMVTAPMALREIALCPWMERGMAYVAFISAGACIALAHFSLIFPRRKKWVVTHPWLLGLPYLYFAVSVGLYLAGITAFGSTCLWVVFWALLIVGATLHAYVTEEDLLLKRQILLFLMIPVLLAIFFCMYIIMPGVMRTNMFQYSYFAILSIASVFSMALAVENQRIYQAALAKEQADLRDRLQMVREVHDNFGNVLSGIVRLADRGHLPDGADSAASAVLPQIHGVAQHCLTEMRDFMVAIDPVSSRWEDYVVQCREHFADYLAAFNIRLTLHAAIDAACETIRPPVQYHLTGILREALGNVIKHAGADEVHVELVVRHGGSELTIEDNGAGCREPARTFDAYGLSNMEGRAKELGGSFRMESTAGGCRLRVGFSP